MSLCSQLFSNTPSCILILSTGGGGDIGSAVYLASALERSGARVVLVALAWERFLHDPSPGPIPLSLFSGVERVEGYLARIVNPYECMALRNGRIIVPSACIVSRLYPRYPVYIVEGWSGEIGVRRAVQDLLSLHGCEAIIVFDVGGDILARGYEENLWSPLADSLGLAAAVNSGVESVVAVHSPGADGELDTGYLLKLVSEISEEGGYVAVRGLDSNDLKVLERVIESVRTEAGRIAVLAAKGYYGVQSIRDGARRVEVSMLQALTIFLSAQKVYERAVARLVSNSWSLEDARRKLNSACIYTELDLEEDLSLFSAQHKRFPTPQELLEVRQRGIERLQKLGSCETRKS